MPSRLRPPINYLNTDLHVVAREDLLPLVRALERGGMYRLHVDTKGSGSRGACLELGDPPCFPNGDMMAILEIVENLKPKPRAIWDRCDLRELNPGFDSGFAPPRGRFNHLITDGTLFRMAEVGLSLRMTIYPPDEVGPPPAARS